MVVAQDCELAWTNATSDVPSIELRPVLTENPPQDWGIRSNRVLITSRHYLDSTSPRVMVTPRILAECAEDGHLLCLLLSAARSVKTWLGLRYDRPAVPGRYVDLHKKLSSQITKRSRRTLGLHVRDVLVRYDLSETGLPTYELVAVLPTSDTPAGKAALALVDELEVWLTDISTSVPATMGVASRLLAQPADRVSLAFVEESYAVDANDVSWPRSGGGHRGAVR
jgi:hypothetical protein